MRRILQNGDVKILYTLSRDHDHPRRYFSGNKRVSKRCSACGERFIASALERICPRCRSDDRGELDRKKNRTNFFHEK